jgi:K+-transporting ATPase KdpF subunit
MQITIILTGSTIANGSLVTGYWAGGLISLMILAYLVYSLMKPEKF